MPDHAAVDFCHQRDRERTGPPECIHDELFGARRVRGRAEGRLGHGEDRRGVGRGFRSDPDWHSGARGYVSSILCDIGVAVQTSNPSIASPQEPTIPADPLLTLDHSSPIVTIQSQLLAEQSGIPGSTGTLSWILSAMSISASIIANQAGSKALAALGQRILDVQAKNIHERAPVILGSVVARLG